MIQILKRIIALTATAKRKEVKAKAVTDQTGAETRKIKRTKRTGREVKVAAAKDRKNVVKAEVREIVVMDPTRGEEIENLGHEKYAFRCIGVVIFDL